MARLSLSSHPGQMEIPQTGTLLLTDYNTALMSLSLAGRAALTVHDVWTDETQLFTTPMPAMEILVTGTPIGGMSLSGGLAAAFDDNLNKAHGLCAQSSAITLGFASANSIGLAVSTSYPITRIVATCPNDSDFTGSGVSTFWKFVGSTTNDPMTGITLACGRTPPTTTFSSPLQIEARFANTTVYPYVWLVIMGNGINNAWCAQLQCYANLSVSSRGITSISSVPKNTSALSALGNSGSISVGALSARYLGTILISEVAGTMRSNLAYGQNRMCPIWNFNDRQRITVMAGDNSDPDPTTHLKYTPVNQPSYAFGPSKGNSNISLTIVNGLAEGSVDIIYEQTYFQDGTASATAVWTGIGINRTDCPFGFWGQQNFDSTGTAQGIDLFSAYSVPPFYGPMTAYAIEGARGNVTGFYGESNMRLCATFEA